MLEINNKIIIDFFKLKNTQINFFYVIYGNISNIIFK